ncbi:MAG: DUF4333 domain-containing protein [Acidimicrobiales bacterium]
MRTLLALLVAGLLVTACRDEGGNKGRVAFSQVEVQAYLEKEVARTMPGFTVGAATCPAELPNRVGATATCTLAVQGVPLDYEVQLLVGDRFQARPARPIVVISEIVASVQAKLGEQASSVRCGDAPIAQPDTSKPLSCEVSGAGMKRTAVVRVSSDGTITITDP